MHKNMENEIQNMEYETPDDKVSVNNEHLGAYIVAAALIIAGAWVYTSGPRQAVVLPSKNTASKPERSELKEKVLPLKGIVLHVQWGDLGAKMVSVGVIDAEKFEELYAGRGGLNSEMKELLYGEANGNLKITAENSGTILNLLLALGLGTKNEILERGEMVDPRYGGACNFASTAGWTLAKGNAMDHYSRHPLVVLTAEQQVLVDKVSRGIYRPCCGNSTHFPDCNHGMAMLGLLELMASQGASEQDMWKAALAVNSYWFPDTYLTIAAYMQNKGVAWKDVQPQEMLGNSYSSAQGYASIAAQIVQPQGQQGGGGCGVDAGVHQTQQQSGCAI